MKVVVFGSRSWTDVITIRERLRELPGDCFVVHGHSPGGGADLIADKEARKLGLTVVRVPINVQDQARAKTRRQAPILRTIRMLDEHPDVELAIGFWDGRSPGSKFTRDECRRRKIPVEIHTPTERTP